MSNLGDQLKPPQNDGKKALGRGLAALINPATRPAPQPVTPAPVEEVKPSVSYAKLELIEVTKIQPNPEQPRKIFDSERLNELSESLKEQGLVQPIVVRRKGEQFEIIAGERRWRAAQIAKIEKIPVIIREDKDAPIANDLASLVENLQREQLSPLELAGAYERIMQTYSMTQEQMAAKIGVSRVAVANTLRLLKLPSEVKEMLADGKITEGHARSLLSLDTPKQMGEVAQKIVMKTLSVREAEQEVRFLKGLGPAQSVVPTQPQSAPATAAVVTAEKDKVEEEKVSALEEELRRIFGTKVVIRNHANRGTIEIYFAGSDSLHRIMHQLRGLSQ